MDLNTEVNLILVSPDEEGVTGLGTVAISLHTIVNALKPLGLRVVQEVPAPQLPITVEGN